MPTQEELKRKIESTEQMGSVVSTMKALAAVSIRQYRRAVEALAGYSRTVEMGLQIILRDRPAGMESVRQGQPTAGGAVVFGSGQGMCGQFNEKIALYARREMESSGGKEMTWKVLAMGAKLPGGLEEVGYPADAFERLPGSLGATGAAVSRVLLRIEKWRAEERIERIVLFHNRPTSGAAYRPVSVRILPLNRYWLESLEAEEWESRSLPFYTLGWDRLFSVLVRQYLFISLYRAFVESLAAENAARLAAMEGAEKNIEEKREEMETEYQRLRQGAITGELLDIVAGYETLTGTGPSGN